MVVGGRVVRSVPAESTPPAGRVDPDPTATRVAPPEPATSSPSASSPSAAGTDPGLTAARQSDAADVWAIPTIERDTQRPEPSLRPARTHRRRRRVDLTLMVAGGIELGSAIFAYLAIATPWVQAEISADERVSARVAGRLLFRGSDAPGAMAVVVVTALMALLGVLWFWYGLDRGVHVPMFAHPALAVIAGLVGLGIASVARIGYVFWQGPLVQHARQIGASRDAMRHLLELHPPPSIAMHQMTGLLRFTIAMATALGAAIVAWWSQRGRA